MPGLSTGLAPNVFSVSRNQTATDTAGICKFPIQYTLTDSFGIFSTALTTNNSTTHARFRLYDGATTGTGTATVITISNTWVADSQRSNGTNYTFAANDWAQLRYSETGTVALGEWSFVVWAVGGTV